MKRQGDLLIIKVTEIPQKAIKQSTRVLAEGEATGHRHQLTMGEVYEKNQDLYFEIKEDHRAILTHPEHKAIVFTPGKYRVIRQREYEPEGWRYVAD